MKRQARIYNVIFPIWILILFPQILVFVIPANLAVDCAVLFLTLLALKHAQKGAVVKKLWWKFWLLGFAADVIGVAWMFLGWLSIDAIGGGLGAARHPGPDDEPLPAPGVLPVDAGWGGAGGCVHLLLRQAGHALLRVAGRQAAAYHRPGDGHCHRPMAVFHPNPPVKRGAKAPLFSAHSCKWQKK